MLHRVRAAAYAGLALAVASCSGGNGPPDVSLTSIDLSPASASLQVGATQQFTATGHYSDGSTAGVAVTWLASGGTISSSGLYTAGAVAGNYQVVATEQGGSISKAAAVTLTTAAPVLTAITVAPSTISLAPNGTQQFTATGHFTGGGTGSVSVAWTATGGTISIGGFYTAGSVVGPYQVTATVTGGSIAGTADVTVTAASPTLTSVTVAPASITLAPSATQQFTATSHYSDGSTSTSLPVDWTAAGGAVNATGFYTAGTTDGTYQVTATATGTAIAGHADVTIATTPPNLVAIEVTPRGVRILPYITQPVQRRGTTERQYHSARRRDMERHVLPTLTAAHNTITSGGLFQAGTVLGSFTVTATEAGGTISGSVPVSVHSTTGLTVAPPSFASGILSRARFISARAIITPTIRWVSAVSTTVAAPAGGVAPRARAMPTSVRTSTRMGGSGEVQVVCQVVWTLLRPLERMRPP